MSDEVTERDVEALTIEERDSVADVIANCITGFTLEEPPGPHMDAAYATVARIKAQARREGAAALVDTVVRNWQGGTGHTDANKWVSIADLKKYAAALRGDA